MNKYNNKIDKQTNDALLTLLPWWEEKRTDPVPPVLPPAQPLARCLQSVVTPAQHCGQHTKFKEDACSSRNIQVKL